MRAGEPKDATMHDAEFDPARASLFTHDVFQPFRVTQYEPLAEALRLDRIDEGTPLLLTERPPTPVALVTTQMAYHHVAQGDIAGHKWMVSF